VLLCHVHWFGKTMTSTMVLHAQQSMMNMPLKRPRVGGECRNSFRRTIGPMECQVSKSVVVPSSPSTRIQRVDHSAQTPRTQANMARMPVRFQSGGSSPLRILCYGDSLTAGFCSYGEQFEPYGRTLADAMGKAGKPCEVSVCGLSGRTAEEMIAEKDSAVFTDSAEVGHVGKGLMRILNEEGPFDVVVILAGTNDLQFAGHSMGAGLTANHILARVKQLHSMCHQLGFSTIALTPPCQMCGPQRVMQQQLAPLLRDWVQTESRVLALYDVEKLAPRAHTGGFWDADDIHMSAAGQRLFGRRLAQFIAPLVEQRVSDITALNMPVMHSVPVTSQPTTLMGGYAPTSTVALRARVHSPRQVLPNDRLGSPIAQFRSSEMQLSTPPSPPIAQARITSVNVAILASA